MFQNGVNLELGQAGCSVVDLGGVGRLCNFISQESPDLFFQVGPAFSSPFNDSQPKAVRDLSAKRNALIDIWDSIGTQFYSVDRQDLSLGLSQFLLDTKNRKFQLLSSNLIRADGTKPFESLFHFEADNQSFVFLSFSSYSNTNRAADWKVLSFSDALKGLSSPLEKYKKSTLIVLGNLSPSERQEITKLIPRTHYFLGGTLDEANSISLEPVGKDCFWAKAADLGRGVGILRWGTPPDFSARSLKKDLDATNQCSERIEQLQKDLSK